MFFVPPYNERVNNRKRGRGRRLYPFRRRTKPGAAPGTVAVDPQSPAPVIDVFGYGSDDFVEESHVSVDRIPELLDRWPVTWVNVDGLGDQATIERIGKIFGLHPLAMEDIVNVHQRAKLDEYGEHLFIVARMLTYGDELETEQLSIVLGKGFVVTFQERPGDVLDPVRARIRSGSIRRTASDYLAYALIDAVVDHYFPLLESYGEHLEKLEETVVSDANDDALASIHRVKHELLEVRRAVWPQREALARLYREPLVLISEETRLYLRDCYDHSVQVIDLLETFREMGGALLDVYLSRASNRLNEVMKVLTIFASVFIPLTFLTGLYGMNFDPDASPLNMPELRWRFGYPYALGLMTATTAATLAFFRHKGWLGGSRRRERSRRTNRPAAAIAGYENESQRRSR